MYRTLVTIGIFLLLPAFANAAVIHMYTNTNAVRVGDAFTVGVSLDTQSAVVNALDGALTFSPNIKLSNIRLAGSLVPLWITTPAEQSANVVNFAGILPGGYKSSSTQSNSRSAKGNIFTLVFTAVSSGVAHIKFGPRTAAYLNDGKGTQAFLATPALTFSIGAVSKSTGVATSKKQKVVFAKDTTPPEPFTPVITSGKPFGYSGPVLVFVAQDKNSGILVYEIARSYSQNPKLSDLSWQTAKSPYKLRTGDRDKFLFVRAIDRAHNMRVERVSPQHISVNALLHQGWVWALIIFMVSVILFGIIKRYLHHS